MNTAVINISNITDTLLVPFAYQHNTARKGDSNVKPYHIIMYDVGLNPLIIIM